MPSVAANSFPYKRKWKGESNGKDLAKLPQFDPDFGKYSADIKQPFSGFVHGSLEDAKSPLLGELTVRERPGKLCFRLGQAYASANEVEDLPNYRLSNPLTVCEKLPKLSTTTELSSQS